MARPLHACLAACLLAVAAQAQQGSPVLIYVTVPDDAALAVDGVPVKQTGPERRLITPRFQPGQKGKYTLTVTYVRDGQPVTVERVIEVEGGQIARVDLSAPPKKVAVKKTEPIKPTEVPDPPKKEEPKKDPPKKEEPKKDPPKKEEPKKDPPKVDPKKDQPKGTPKLDSPYSPSPPAVVEAMLKLAGVTDKDTVYDLGCGDGRIVVMAADKFKARKAVGIDLDPVRVKQSKDNAAKSPAVEIREGDVLKMTDFSDATVVTLYLLPEMNAKLKPALRKSLKPGARIVSHDFEMGDDWPADRHITVKDEKGDDHTVYLWTIPGKAEEKKPEEKKPNAKAPAKLDAPFLPTPHSVVSEMLKLAGVKEGETVYDLGCGDGRIVIAAVKDFKAKKGVGVDLDPERIAESKAAAVEAKVADKVEFRTADVLKLESVADADVVCLYLFPEVNEKLRPMLLKTLKPGARIVSHDFRLGAEFPPEKTIEVKDAGGDVHELYLWTIKKQ